MVGRQSRSHMCSSLWRSSCVCFRQTNAEAIRRCSRPRDHHSRAILTSELLIRFSFSLLQILDKHGLWNSYGHSNMDSFHIRLITFSPLYFKYFIGSLDLLNALISRIKCDGAHILALKIMASNVLLT